MKNQKVKFILLSIFLSLFYFNGQSQQTTLKFIGSANKFSLAGIGDIQGTKGDNAKLAYWAIANTTNFDTKVYLKFLKSGKAGVIVREANTTNNLQGGRPCYFLYINKSNSTLRFDSRIAYNTAITNISTVALSVTQGVWLSLKKEGDKLTARYSYDAETSTNITWTNVLVNATAFANYSDYIRGVVVASGSTVNQNGAIFSNWKESSAPIALSSPTIASSIVPLIVGANAILSATGCIYTLDWYKNNSYVTSTSTLTVGNAVLNDIYSAKCRNVDVLSGFSNEIIVNNVVILSNNTTNFVPDLPINAYDKWNYFDPNDIPDFTTAKSVDIKTKQYLPNKWFIWHAPYMNLFGSNSLDRLTKMVAKGVTAWNISKLPAYNFTLSNIITPERIVSESGGLGKKQNDGLWDEEKSYGAFINWAKGGVTNASNFGVNAIGGKYGQFLTISDYENYYTNLTTQEASNYHTVALNSMANITVGRVGFQYGLGLNTLGYYTSNLYNGSNNVWALAANAPTDFIGLSSASNSRIVGVNEITYAYETFLAEGYQVKDQSNTDWFKIKHFGRELNNEYGSIATTNAQHWATNIGVGTETAYNLHKTFAGGAGQDLIVQLKPGNETDNGFHYDTRYGRTRYGNYVARYGVTQQGFVYNDDGTVKSTFDYLEQTNSEYIPNFIAEGQIELAYFSGAKGVNWWSSDFTDVAIPKPIAGNPRRGAKYNDVNYGNRDLSCYIYTLKALWRLNQKVTLSNGKQYSFAEICDGTEIYLNQNTPVIYPTINTTNDNSVITATPNTTNVVSKLRALDWQILRHSPVRAVVNTKLNVVFVIAFQAYGVEDSQVTFRLTDYGADITDLINLDANKIIIKAYPLTGGKIVEGGIVSAPTITSSPSPPVAGTNTTFTANGCNGTVKWFIVGGDGELSSNNVLTVSYPVVNTTYYATCTVNNVSSSGSNNITVANAPTVTGNLSIIEPVKDPLYFSDGHTADYYDLNNRVPAHTPAIHKSSTRTVTDYAGKTLSGITMKTDYDKSNDIVWMSNNKIKIGINLLRGGQIAWASLIDATNNLVYNGYDGGFQITMDMYQKKDGYTQNGKTSRANFDPNSKITSYNTTMGGDFNNNSQSLISYGRVGDSYIVKYRPIFYTLDCEWSEVYVTVKYTLDGYSVKCEYTYDSFRHDTQFDGGGFDSGDVPACFIVNTLNHYKTYVGTNPFNNDSNVESGTLPIENYGQGILGRNSSERWALVYNPTTDESIGIYIPRTGGQQFQLKQLEVYSGQSAGTEFKGGFTYFGSDQRLLGVTETTADRTNLKKTFNAYLIIGERPERIRSEAVRFNAQ
jgi:hypothetical protein